MLVNGIMEKKAIIKAWSETALVVLLKLANDSQDNKAFYNVGFFTYMCILYYILIHVIFTTLHSFYLLIVNIIIFLLVILYQRTHKHIINICYI